VYNAFINEGFTVKVDEVGLRGGYIASHHGSSEKEYVLNV